MASAPYDWPQSRGWQSASGEHRGMIDSRTTPEFQRGWDAALAAARRWHEAQASKTIIQARRTRFPKNLEREAEVHRRSAELIVTLSPNDV